MSFPIEALPLELLDIILKLLGPQDIINLAKSVPVNITREVYHHAFHDNARFLHYNLDMFEKRANASVYAIGVGLCNHHLDDTPDENKGSRYEPILYTRGMYTPSKIKTDGIIVEGGLKDCKWWFLYADGEMTVVGYLSVYEVISGDWDSHSTYRPTMVHSRQPDDYDKNRSRKWRQELQRSGWARGSEKKTLLLNELLRNTDVKDKDLARESNKLYSGESEPSRIVRIGNDTSPWGLDQYGWSWWFLDESGGPGFPVAFVEKGTERWISKGILCVKSRITHKYFLACQSGEGVFVSDPKWLDTEFTNGIRSRILCFDDHVSRIEVSLIPGTKGVHSFGLFRSIVVCLLPSGIIAGFPYGNWDRFDLEAVTRLNKYGPFVQLACSDLSIGVVTETGRIVIVNHTYGKPVDTCVVEDFVGSYISDLVLRDHHYFVLTTNGDVYTWGTVDKSGCLGLGKREDAMKLDGVMLETHDMEDYLVAHKPTKVNLPGKAYAIYADDHLSAFLVDDS